MDDRKPPDTNVVRLRRNGDLSDEERQRLASTIFADQDEVGTFSRGNLMIHHHGAQPYEIGPEIWQQPLTDAIQAEAEAIAGFAGPDLLESPDRKHRDQLRERIIAEMTGALKQIGDTYKAPDGIRYSLTESPAHDADDEGTLTPVSASAPVVVEVLRFEDLPPGSSGSKRAVVRWTDGSEGEGLRWFAERSSYAKAIMGTLGLCPLELSRTVLKGRFARGGAHNPDARLPRNAGLLSATTETGGG
jgi:hypothetical protein